MDAAWPYLAAILPTILVAVLFYFIIKSMLEGDRRERAAQRRFEAQQDAAGRNAVPNTAESADSADSVGSADSADSANAAEAKGPANPAHSEVDPPTSGGTAHP